MNELIENWIFEKSKLVAFGCFAWIHDKYKTKKKTKIFLCFSASLIDWLWWRRRVYTMLQFFWFFTRILNFFQWMKIFNVVVQIFNQSNLLRTYRLNYWKLIMTMFSFFPLRLTNSKKKQKKYISTQRCCSSAILFMIQINQSMESINNKYKWYISSAFG